jgi:hypothetical protein
MMSEEEFSDSEDEDAERRRGEEEWLTVLELLEKYRKERDELRDELALAEQGGDDY